MRHFLNACCAIASFLLIFLLAALFAFVFLAAIAAAHQAPSGWQYPPSCCNQNDCAPVIAMQQQADGSLHVSTKHGSAVFPADFRRQESPDGQAHACFTPQVLYCLFLGPGT